MTKPFLDTFSKGAVLRALQGILQRPEMSYDDSCVSESINNFVDATVFGTMIDALHASTILEAEYEPIRPLLQQIKTSRMLLMQEESPEIPENYLLDSWNGLKTFKENKEAFGSLLDSYRNWFSFKYPMSAEVRYLCDTQDMPLLILEPLTFDFTDLLKAYSGKPALFVFESQATFSQMLQYPEVVQSLSEREHLIYIMQLHPEKQFALQEPYTFSTFQPILFTKRPILESALSPLIQALQKRDWNWLYHISKRTLFCLDEYRLGKNRAAALIEKTSSQNWNDPYKSLAPKGLPLGPEPKDYFGMRCKELARTRHPKAVSKDKKLRLAHIVPQVVEGGGHAPTGLLTNLIQFHDANRFDLFLICTERLAFHPYEYPYIFEYSGSSYERADSLLKKFQTEGTEVIVLDAGLNYEKSAKIVSDYLRSQDIDIAVFHGPDVINTLAAQTADVGLRVMFEHGTQPSYPGFDAVITSTNDALTLYQETFQKFGMQAVAIGFSADQRANWNKPAPTKTELGFTEDSFIMTTISNHLESRLGDEMCLAIAEILTRCPKAIYAPIGPISKKEKFEVFFKKHGVADRVKFLGEKQNASHYARAMQLYLNEFPFGSCLGMLDAMASGCPIVSMHDENGPQQARYAAAFFGLDRVVTSQKREDYVALACSLIENREKYLSWREHALREYEKRTDVKAYVACVEKSIISFLPTA